MITDTLKFIDDVTLTEVITQPANDRMQLHGYKLISCMVTTQQDEHKYKENKRHASGSSSAESTSANCR
jgi:dGTP triphosphohydrolase